MKEKIINVKNILKIITMLIIIFSMAKSCAQASNYTLTDADIQGIVNTYWTGNTATLYYNALKTNYQTYSQQYDTCAIATQTYNNGNIAISYFNKADVTAINNQGNINYMGITINGTAMYSSLTFVPGGRWRNR